MYVEGARAGCAVGDGEGGMVGDGEGRVIGDGEGGAAWSAMARRRWAGGCLYYGFGLLQRWRGYER